MTSTTLALAAALGAGCGSEGKQQTGTAGTGNSAGGGAGGTAPLPPGLGQGGPYPYPQNKVSGSCMLTSVPNAAASTESAYNSWRNTFVVSDGAGGYLRVRSPQHANGTVSEGIGYGMLAAVYKVDRLTFDGLWNYGKLHFDNKGLMNWKITAAGATASDGAGSASDGDEDMIWALLMASNQWNAPAYLNAAKDMINAMYLNSIASDGTLKPGDNWGGTTMYFPDYFSPAYFRVFARAVNQPHWSGAILSKNYEILSQVSGTYGLVPDSTNLATPPFPVTAPYGYDACRTPWRIAMDYCFNGEPRAKAYLDKIGPFFNGVGAANIGDRYNTSGGAAVMNNHNMAFIGPAGTAGMAGWPSLLNDAFMFGANNSGGDSSYYAQSLRVVTMLMMSGNFLDYSQ